MLRNLLDKVEPLFHKGGKLEKLYPLYEANDTFLYTPGEVAEGKTHVRDAIDTKRMMSMVIVALIPCIFMAMYNTGYQAQKIMAAGQTVTGSATIGDALWSGNWRYDVLDRFNVVEGTPLASSESSDQGKLTYTCDSPGSFFSLGSMLGCLLHGALYFLPVYIVCMVVGGHCEVIFSVIRKHEINEGFLVTGMLFPLTLPANIPLWQVAVGIAFGVVIGKEIFGGTGRNFLNPALTARAFLYFAYPKQISGDAVWTAVDGYSGATVLGAVATDGAAQINETVASMGSSWMNFFIGNIHGSMGETSTMACLIGAVVLIASRIGSWRIMAGCLIGMIGFSSVLTLVSSTPAMDIAPWWHMVIGGFAFGTVFMATDPVSASMTLTGKWAYGILIGFMTVLVRSVNPAFPEGIMLAILFANVFAPVIDWCVVQANIKRRAARYAT